MVQIRSSKEETVCRIEVLCAYGPLLTNVIVDLGEIKNLVFGGFGGMKAFVLMEPHLEVHLPNMEDDFLSPSVGVRSKIVMVHLDRLEFFPGVD